MSNDLFEEACCVDIYRVYSDACVRRACALPAVYNNNINYRRKDVWLPSLPVLAALHLPCRNTVESSSAHAAISSISHGVMGQAMWMHDELEGLRVSHTW